MAIAPTTKIEFFFRDTYQCGNEEANVGHILITTGEYQITAEGVFTYKATTRARWSPYVRIGRWSRASAPEITTQRSVACSQPGPPMPLGEVR